MIGLATARIAATTATETELPADYLPSAYHSHFHRKSAPMSIPNGTAGGHHTRVSPVDTELDVVAEVEAEVSAISVSSNTDKYGGVMEFDGAPGPAVEQRNVRKGANGVVVTQLSSSSATTTDSAISSGPDAVQSRRGSNPLGEFKGYVRSRRQTITSRFPSRISGPPATPEQSDDTRWRKVSTDSQFDDDNESDEEFFNTVTYQRRMSVPEKTLRKANYAILRKSQDRRFEIVGAFKKYESDAYRHFLQSLTCFDLAPPHGVVIILHAELSVQKAVAVMCQNPGNRAAIVSRASDSDDGYFGIFSVTDCLYALKMAAEEDSNIGNESLQYFLDNVQVKKKVVTVSSSMTIWEIARLFRYNRVHRIPVLEVDNYVQTNEILSFICLRQIFVEVLKFLDMKCHLTPNLSQLTLGGERIGCWAKLAWISENALVAEAVNKFLTCKVSCLPLLDEEQRVIALITKNDVLDAVAERGNKNYLEVLDLPAKSIVRENSLEFLASPEDSIEDAIKLLINSFRQCLFIVHDKCLLGVVSYSDVMEYILNSSKVPSTT